MYCRNCGKEINDDVTFCPNCGQAVRDRQTADSGSSTYQYGNGGSDISYTQDGSGQYDGGQSYNGEPHPYQTQPVKRDPDGFAIASLILGIISFFILPLIGGILAIVFANKSMRENGVNTMARVGRILGIISLVICIIAVIIIIVSFVVFGVGLLSAVY